MRGVAAAAPAAAKAVPKDPPRASIIRQKTEVCRQERRKAIEDSFEVFDCEELGPDWVDGVYRMKLSLKLHKINASANERNVSKLFLMKTRLGYQPAMAFI